MPSKTPWINKNSKIKRFTLFFCRYLLRAKSKPAINIAVKRKRMKKKAGSAARSTDCDSSYGGCCNINFNFNT